MELRRSAKPSLTPIELNHEDTLCFRLSDETVWEMLLLDTGAEVVERKYAQKCAPSEEGDISVYAFWARVVINGQEHELRREVGTQQSFYEPWELDGVHLWFDAADAAFSARGGFMQEKDWLSGQICQPRKRARFAVQEANRSVCPEPVALWYTNPELSLNIEDCYRGEDCWMGPYNGAKAHGGLDINMPAGTFLFAPINFDNQFYFNSLNAGYANNRWRGVRRWPDSSQWMLQSHHLISLQVEQNRPLNRGEFYATTAGVLPGAREHTHFVFRVIEQEGEYLLDPWILFWQMFRDVC